MSAPILRSCAAGRACAQNWAGPSRQAARCLHVASAAPTASIDPLLWQGSSARQHVSLSTERLRSSEARREPDGFFTPARHRRPGLPASFPFGTSEPTLEGGSEQRNPQRDGKHRVSDHEYSVRVGQAFDLLRATIPDFMRIGLVDYDNAKPSSSSSPTGMSLLDVLMFRSLRARSGTEEDDMQARGRGIGSSASVYEGASSYDEATSPDNLVYHPSIQFHFCAGRQSDSAPTSSELTDAEAASLSFSGRSLYFASAHALRHTLNILFSNARVEIERIRLEKKGRGAAWCDRSTAESSDLGSAAGATSSAHSTGQMGNGGDAIHLRVRFTGNLRLTNIEHRYTLVFRYDIDGETGRIAQHTVERVEPAIGRKLWTVIANVWDRITGHSSRTPDATPMPAPCIAHQQSAMYRHRQHSDRIVSESTSSE